MQHQLKGGGYIFTPLRLDAKPLFDSYFSQERYESSDCTFANLFIWRHVYSYEWALVDGFLWVKGRAPEQVFVLPPLGDIKPEMSASIKKLGDYFADQGLPFCIKGATVDIVSFFARNWPNGVVFSPDRNSFDYVYRSRDLINLAGSNYRAKRNHLNHFKRFHPDYKFVPMADELIPELITGMQTWYPAGENGQPAITSDEKSALEEALAHWSALELSGGAILVNDKVEAFSLGEELNEDTFVVHIEKANPRIRGIYQAINQEFCQKYCASKQYVNREEDMGIAGIRTAKTAYHPVRYVAKINIIAKSKLQ